MMPEIKTKPLLDFLANQKQGRLREMFHVLGSICQESQKPVVLMIDEIDSAGSHQVFIDFLAQLRARYLIKR